MAISESSIARYTLHDPDVRLMLAVRDDDASAFEELMRRYQERLVTVLDHLVSNRDQAEDLAQEVFLRVYRSRKGYVPGAKFSTWLFTIANNIASNARRSRSRRKEVNLDLRPAASSGAQSIGELAAAASALMPARLIDKAEMREVVRQALTTLERTSAAGGLVEQIREHELRGHCRNHGVDSAGRKVAALAGTLQPARGFGAVLANGRIEETRECWRKQRRMTLVPTCSRSRQTSVSVAGESRTLASSATEIQT